MKRTTVVLSLLLLSAPGWCFDTKENPDKVPSLGLEYSGASFKGDTEYQDFTFFTAQPQMKETDNDIEADFRLPVTNNLTLNVGGGYGSHKIEGNDATIFLLNGGGTAIVTDPTTTTLKGPIYKVGLRYYFQ